MSSVKWCLLQLVKNCISTDTTTSKIAHNTSPVFINTPSAHTWNMPYILRDSSSGKIAQVLVVLINNVSSQASLLPLPSFLTSPSPPTLSRLARPSQLPAFLLFFFASTSIYAVVSEWVTRRPIPWLWSFMYNIWVEYCDVRAALHWGHVFLSDVSGIALWGCSLNVFVFIFVFAIVFLLVGSCLLITLITCLFLSCLWVRKLIF